MIELTDFMLRASVATGLGLLIGYEREQKAKPLGMRAYMLIALGSCGLMMVTLNFSLSTVASDPDMSVDPTRVIQGMLGGIGFLGGGAIISNSSDGRLRGVGSGAAIWGIGGIGIACGLGYLWEAAFLAGLTFLILTVCDRLQHDGALPDGADDQEKDK